LSCINQQLPPWPDALKIEAVVKTPTAAWVAPITMLPVANPITDAVTCTMLMEILNL